jgi:hypothetical protein
MASKEKKEEEKVFHFPLNAVASLAFFFLHSLVVSSFVRFDGLGRLDRMTATTNRLFHPS